MQGHRNIGGFVTTKKALRPQSSAAVGSYGLNGVTIDREGHQSALLRVGTGAASGTPTTIAVDAKLQDSADGSSWADVAVSPQNPAVAIAQITAINTDKFLEIDLSGLRRYIRFVHQVAFTGGTSPAVLLDSECVLGGGPVKPTVHV